MMTNYLVAIIITICWIEKQLININLNFLSCIEVLIKNIIPTLKWNQEELEVIVICAALKRTTTHDEWMTICFGHFILLVKSEDTHSTQLNLKVQGIDQGSTLLFKGTRLDVTMRPVSCLSGTDFILFGWHWKTFVRSLL